MISFFGKQTHFRAKTITANYPHLISGSSMIRGEQMAEYMGGKYIVEKYNEDCEGVCIYIKPSSLEELKDGSYVEVVDDHTLATRLVDYPKLNIIVLSQSGFRYLRSIGAKNKIVIIPQHHCNFDREKRDRKKVTTVGMIGSKDSFDYPIHKFKKMMKDIGLKFITNYSFRNRGDIVDFYKKIDIQVAWNDHYTYQKYFRDSLRIKNAASFGIPTVSFPEQCWKEFEGNYIRVRSIDNMCMEIKKLKDENHYKKWSDKAIKESEKFHISNIAKKYEAL